MDRQHFLDQVVGRGSSLNLREQAELTAAVASLRQRYDLDALINRLGADDQGALTTVTAAFERSHLRSAMDDATLALWLAGVAAIGEISDADAAVALEPYRQVFDASFVPDRSALVQRRRVRSYE